MVMRRNNSNCKVKYFYKKKAKTARKGYFTLFTNRTVRGNPSSPPQPSQASNESVVSCGSQSCCTPCSSPPPKKRQNPHKKKQCRPIRRRCRGKHHHPCRRKKGSCRIKLKQPVQVVAKRLDIRRLTPVKDKVEIFGTDGVRLQPVRTDSSGRLEIVPSSAGGTQFTEEAYFNWTVTSELSSLPLQDTAVKTVTSYAVINKGEHPAIVRLDISPNGLDFVTDQLEPVEPNTMGVFIPQRFLKWARLSAQTGSAQANTALDVYFQGQTMGC